MKLRSVELLVPDVAVASDFLTGAWGLLDAGTRGNVRFTRGTGAHPYVLSLTQASEPGVKSVSFSGSEPEVKALLERVKSKDARTSGWVGEFDEPGAAAGFFLEGLEGQIYRFLVEKQPVEALPAERERPIQLTHCVMNVTDRAACTKFAQEVFAFKLSDRTGVMSFIRCNEQHHALAYADAKVSSLNHLAFEMTDLEAVMCGIGRMKDKGFDAVWGPGRHGPGNNVFGYFVAPFGAVIEYTSEIHLVDDSYREGAPEDWKWPPGRMDHWGVSGRDMARMHEAEQRYRFRPFAESARMGG
jgi:catechol 2,3-dioxygenase-like lactoylglutathione lyase family enzyme